MAVCFARCPSHIQYRFATPWGMCLAMGVNLSTWLVHNAAVS